MTTVPADQTMATSVGRPTLEPLVMSAAHGDADAFGQLLTATSSMVASISEKVNPQKNFKSTSSARAGSIAAW